MTLCVSIAIHALVYRDSAQKNTIFPYTVNLFPLCEAFSAKPEMHWKERWEKRKNVNKNLRTHALPEQVYKWNETLEN